MHAALLYRVLTSPSSPRLSHSVLRHLISPKVPTRTAATMSSNFADRRTLVLFDVDGTLTPARLVRTSHLAP